MREKLIELLDGIQSHGWRRIETDHSITLAVVENKAIAEHLLANGVTIRKWIPVTERLPDRECIAIGYQNEMLIGYISKNRYSKTGFSAEGAEEYLGEVTHWMPLPEPPKED